MGQAADFFVSYTSVDRAWAEWVAWQLEAEGYTVVVQAWDFTPGRDWTHEMQHATATAKRVVAVLSAAYLESEHGEAEWRVFYAQDPSGERGLLLPVRVDRVEPPGLLKTRIYVDLVDQDAASARQTLLAAARGARGKPTQEPEFPGDRRSVGSATETPRYPGELPPVWNVPYHPNSYFTGREGLLADVHARLTTPDQPTRRVALTGAGGMGKTQSAVEYAYRWQAEYDLVWWVRSEQPTSLLSDYVALANQPPLLPDLSLGQDAPQEATVAAVRSWLEQHRRWLLVLDSLEDPQAVADLLPRSSTGHVLLTSQSEIGWEPLAQSLPVEVLTPTDAAGFLLARTQQTGPSVEAAATNLATTLGGLPLALEQAAAYVAASGTISLAGYAELFATRALELLRRGQPLGYQHTVATTWSLALQRLQETEPAAVGLLTLGAFLAPNDLPEPLLTAHHEELLEPLAGAARDPLALADAVSALRRYSLVRVIADGFSVHRLLQIVVLGALDVDTQKAWTASVVRLLDGSFPHRGDEVATWAECDRLLPHVLAAVDHGQRLGVEIEAWLCLLHHAALYLWSRGQYRQALTLQERALAGARQVFGDDHPNTSASMNNVAETRRNLGDLDGARQLHEQVLNVNRRLRGDDDPNTLTSMNNLALTLRYLKKFQAAHDLYQQSLSGRRRVHGDDHPDTLQSMNNLAETLRNLGDLQAAQDLLEQTLAASRRILGDHPMTLAAMSNLARTRADLGDFPAAQDLLEQTLATSRRILGDNHPNTQIAKNDLGTVRQALQEKP